ncbi:Chymotrypsin-like elastase family member 2B,Prostasin,Transmembrane protease serine 3,Transmembrane protease serine 11F,Trypsin,Transmembrane protease serine 11E,Tryptase gamma,Transmembrane protease serine 9,Transmembrane protease serine 11D,Trypsin V-B,Tryptase delta,Cationic trypsin,Transmembrane protease serine 11G,Transmembrane protease serine 7,Cationic trypsin-3,Transmembrane protease serine 5,Polyserase-2,Tryptase,Transmembrane protease serine 11A,Tryptase alpha/beta-1,Plasminogen,Chymotrypsinogen|uniref:Uncharacterized protein n=1 Tax=Mytilus coruscus TaxID=42192 RepID=A0A6J8DNY1_MYTCO|nr:Chymotrypsin-like elastase family member 2B,Prostasin,Transmembrane protease serine 3,Transmembrane protease serine 11F,Trypsin,Transmembrane protease serine 11E,Tryptase gamma,Transmembrane protease serine 9,Transmembrane protease serine 11D,Trypsin V-B,Tryptase delta,Cationic trypsin,Transmembrane protease serine 11G,Transmembrane protease serine 7,Cationic trypsin-3,Transmembrane protease serine 5,Polyserase-2,Tryptase,Transmembrane protease serine 11A,Tryptase alpha/beta-1,Plasminogen,Chymot
MVGYEVHINILVFMFQTIYAGTLKDLLVTNIKDTSATIKWNPPNQVSGNLNGYRIKFEETGHPKTGFGVSILASSLNYTIAALSPSTNYTVSLFASTNMGRILISSTKFKTTDTIAITTTVYSSGTCNDHLFDCLNGRCISHQWVCDGENDCGNLKDEENCIMQKVECSSSEFKCGNGGCIPAKWRCDYNDDCGDNSDEQGCGNTLSGCGGLRNRTGTEGDIRGRYYPYEFPNNRTCTWDITVPDDMFIKIHFLSRFRVKASRENCTDKYVAVYQDNGKALGKYCGRKPPLDMKIESNRVRIVFKTINMTRHEGFSMHWSAVNATKNNSGSNQLDKLVCNKVFTIDNETTQFIDTSELIQTFDFQCVWFIEAPKGYSIRFRFTDFNLNEDRYCLHDSIIIMDGPNLSIPFGPYCGQTIPLDIVTSYHIAKIIYQLDPINGTSGFSLQFSAVEMPTPLPTLPVPKILCDHDIYYTEPDFIVSPNYGYGNYYPRLRCLWRIFAPSGYLIRLHFTYFDIEFSQNCLYDALTITDGTSPSGDVLTTLCGQMFPDDVLSKTNSVVLTFVSDDNKSGSGFNITYTIENKTEVDNGNIVEKLCRNGTVISKNDSQGEILSPGYALGRKYPTNINCSWFIEAPMGKVISLTFNDFEVENERDCHFDSMSIFDRTNGVDTLIQTLCGPAYPNRLTSTSNLLFMVFHSDDSDTRSGFNITYDFRDPVRLYDKHCGKPSIQPVNVDHRIFGGQEAKPGSWPWQVSLKHDGDHLCGGTLIHPEWIVTASHCFERHRSTKHWTANLGEHHMYKDDPGAVQAAVKTIIVHEHYGAVSTNNDIALVQLQIPLTLNDKIDTVCLPKVMFKPGTLCYVTGFGEVLGTCCPFVLKQAAVPIDDLYMCNETSNLQGQITENMFCAGKGGNDACNGDSGGPLVCKDSDGKWELSGITSFGIGCGDPNSPGVYTKVSNYISWIHQTIAEYS